MSDPLERLRELEKSPPRPTARRNFERDCEEWRNEIMDLIAGPLDDPNTAHDISMFTTDSSEHIEKVCKYAREVISEHDVKRRFRTPSAAPSPSVEERVAEIQRATQIEVAKIHAEGAKAAAKFQSDATETAARFHGEATKSAAQWGALAGIVSGSAVAAIVAAVMARGCP